MIKKHLHINQTLLVAFLIPIVLMGSYFAFRKMAPFGSSSILTVDLGQQYVDFFAYFRNIIIHHPSSFLYSFSKGLGGEMLGTNAYYLMSPVNFLLLFFPGKLLSSGILIILLVKYGLAGLSFAWLLQRQHLQTSPRIWAFSTAYALMGWIIANQLNILWLDVLFLLPPVIDGLITLVRRKSPWRFVIWLALTMIDNYYMAWMVCLFSLLFFIWLISQERTGWSGTFKQFIRFIGYSILSALLSAFLLLPTIFSLTQSKGTYTEQKIKWATEYNPLKILAKFVPGSFNFGQMPSGQPNFYVGMLLSLGAILYFIYAKDRIVTKVVALAITAFIVCSFFLQPLDLLWHLGQFPVWYPSRFAFVFSFWIVWLAALTLQPDCSIRWPVALLLLVICSAVAIYLLKVNSKISYITTGQIGIGFGFVVISIIFLMIERHQSPKLVDLLFMLLIILDVMTNAYTSLNHISYVSQAEFGNYTVAMDKAVDKTQASDSGWYRIAKNFMRTKDDPFQADYYGGEHFGSTMEPAITTFMGSIGQPAGDGFIAYSNGTQVTDSLLGFKYFLQARNHGEQNGNQVLPITSTRADWYHVPTIKRTNMVNIKKNQNALPVAFGTSSKILQLKPITLDPLNYQSQVFQTLAGQSNLKQLFQVQNFDHVTFHNVQTSQQITGTTFTKKNPDKSASVALHFTPSSNESYYLTLGSSVKSVASIYLNGRTLDQYPTYRNTISVNVANHQKGKPVTIKFVLKKQTMWMQNVSLYKLNQKLFKHDVKTIKHSAMHVTKQSSNRISGTINIKKNHQLLMTTIPYASGWHVKIDGQTVTPVKVLHTFMAIPISKGYHRVTMTFIPPFLILGTVISLGALGGCVIAIRRKHHSQK